MTRRKLLVHALNWVGAAAPPPDAAACHDLVVAGLTDVWSATRTSVAALLADVLARTPLAAVEGLCRQLAGLCTGAPGGWQAREGALLGLTAIVRRFVWETRPGSGLGGGGVGGGGGGGGGMDTLTDRAHEFGLVFGPTRLPHGLPVFVRDAVQSVLCVAKAGVAKTRWGKWPSPHLRLGLPVGSPCWPTRS